MKKTAKVSTEFGPVDIDLTQCDGVGCTSCMQTAFLMGWHKLEPLGMEVAAFGQLPGPLEFCSLTCLIKTVGQISGN